DLRCVFVGYNPSIMSSKRGHRYAHPTNQFWSLLYQSEIVPEKLTPYSDSIMPERYRLGFTDLVARPTRRASDLSREEMIQGALILEERITRNKPKCVCIVGKGIWECIMRARGTKVGKDFEWGLQNAILGQSAVFVVPSTSGLVAAITRERKLEIWRELAGFLN
ncbi:G/U mismatch-specific DNA glycosylase, partial [Nadsonia fulvescens var. elongata DSM 6958]